MFIQKKDKSKFKLTNKNELLHQMNCVSCKKKLVVIGTARKNGVQHHGDWESREYHKKCWKDIKCKKKPESEYLKGFRELCVELNLMNLKNKNII